MHDIQQDNPIQWGIRWPLNPLVPVRYQLADDEHHARELWAQHDGVALVKRAWVEVAPPRRRSG